VHLDFIWWGKGKDLYGSGSSAGGGGGLTLARESQQHQEWATGMSLFPRATEVRVADK